MSCSVQMMSIIFAILFSSKVFAGTGWDKKLMEAIDRHDAQAAIVALTRGANPNQHYGDEDTPLLRALYDGNAPLARALLEYGADPNAPTRQDYRPLMALGYFKDAPQDELDSLVHLMKKKGADFNHPEPNYGYTPLQWHAKYNQLKAIRALVKNGADLEAEGGYYGASALIVAIQEHSGSVVRLLLQLGADPNRKHRNRSAFDAAVTSDSEEMLKILLSDVKEVSAEALLFAAEHGKVPVVVAMLDKGNMDATNNDGRSVLMQAVNQKKTDLVTELLRRGAKVNLKDNNGDTALIFAARVGSVPIAKMLIDKKADPDIKGNSGTALFFAAEGGFDDVMDVILNAKPDLGDRFTGNWSALFSAAHHNRVLIAKRLLDSGVKVDQRDESGFTPLITAAENGSREVAELLLSRAAQIEAVSSFTPMWECVGPCRLTEGTALMWAAAMGQMDMVRFLVSKGANPRAKTKTGVTSLKAALMNHHDDIAQFLRQKGATE